MHNFDKKSGLQWWQNRVFLDQNVIFFKTLTECFFVNQPNQTISTALSQHKLETFGCFNISMVCRNMLCQHFFWRFRLMTVLVLWLWKQWLEHKPVKQHTYQNVKCQIIININMLVCIVFLLYTFAWWSPTWFNYLWISLHIYKDFLLAYSQSGVSSQTVDLQCAAFPPLCFPVFFLFNLSSGLLIFFQTVFLLRHFGTKACQEEEENGGARHGARFKCTALRSHTVHASLLE